jgi:hypothetical protein
MRLLVVPVLALLSAHVAQAESLRIEAWYPAVSDDIAALRSIQVDALGGRAGPSLTIQVDDKLRELDLGEGRWFRVIPASLANGDGDAVLRGTADMDLDFDEYSEQRERCIKDNAGKCTDTKEKYPVYCIRRKFELTLALRLVGRDGSLLWSDNGVEPHSDSRCSDDSTKLRSVNVVERMLTGRVAGRIQSEFAPRRVREEIRVDENRRGLSRADGEAFKAAVRAVKDRREIQACELWKELGQRYADHLPTQFNMGLCAEFLGDDAAAGTQYQRVVALSPRHSAATAALRRLDARKRGLRQLDLHARN